MFFRSLLLLVVAAPLAIGGPRDKSLLHRTDNDGKDTGQSFAANSVSSIPLSQPFSQLPSKDEISVSQSTELPPGKDKFITISSIEKGDKSTSHLDKDNVFSASLAFTPSTAKDEKVTSLPAKDKDLPTSLPSKDKDRDLTPSVPFKDDKNSSLSLPLKDQTSVSGPKDKPTSLSANDKDLPISLPAGDKRKDLTPSVPSKDDKKPSISMPVKDRTTISGTKDKPASSVPVKDNKSKAILTVLHTNVYNASTSSKVEPSAGPVIVYSLTIPAAPTVTRAKVTASNGATSPGRKVYPTSPALTLTSLGGVSGKLEFPGYDIMTLKDVQPNQTSSIIPVYTPAILGNAYGGGFVVTPSVYVTKKPFPSGPSQGVPPGYGSSSQATNSPVPNFGPSLSSITSRNTTFTVDILTPSAVPFEHQGSKPESLISPGSTKANLTTLSGKPKVTLTLLPGIASSILGSVPGIETTPITLEVVTSNVEATTKGLVKDKNGSVTASTSISIGKSRPLPSTGAGQLPFLNSTKAIVVSLDIISSTTSPIAVGRASEDVGVKTEDEISSSISSKPGPEVTFAVLSSSKLEESPGGASTQTVQVAGGHQKSSTVSTLALAGLPASLVSSLSPLLAGSEATKSPGASPLTTPGSAVSSEKKTEVSPFPGASKLGIVGPASIISELSTLPATTEASKPLEAGQSNGTQASTAIKSPPAEAISSLLGSISVLFSANVANVVTLPSTAPDLATALNNFVEQQGSAAGQSPLPTLVPVSGNASAAELEITDLGSETSVSLVSGAIAASPGFVPGESTSTSAAVVHEAGPPTSIVAAPGSDLTAVPRTTGSLPASESEQAQSASVLTSALTTLAVTNGPGKILEFPIESTSEQGQTAGVPIVAAPNTVKGVSTSLVASEAVILSPNASASEPGQTAGVSILATPATVNGGSISPAGPEAEFSSPNASAASKQGQTVGVPAVSTATANHGVESPSASTPTVLGIPKTPANEEGKATGISVMATPTTANRISSSPSGSESGFGSSIASATEQNQAIDISSEIETTAANGVLSSSIGTETVTGLSPATSSSENTPGLSLIPAGPESVARSSTTPAGPKSIAGFPSTPILQSTRTEVGISTGLSTSTANGRGGNDSVSIFLSPTAALPFLGGSNTLSARLSFGPIAVLVFISLCLL